MQRWCTTYAGNEEATFKGKNAIVQGVLQLTVKATFVELPIDDQLKSFFQSKYQ